MGIFNKIGTGNVGHNQVGPLLTVEALRKVYLFGVDKISDDLGNVLEDEVLQTFINNAISTIEMDLDLFVGPRDIEEHKDYNANDYWEWGYLQLNRFPIITCRPVTVQIVYLRDRSSQLQVVLDIPQEWIRLDPFTGILRLIPNNRFPGNLQVGSGGTFFPELFRRNSMVPDLWQVSYTTGFEDGCVPSAVNAAIGLQASIYALNSLADLNLGAGIAGTSISLDGLSQSLQSTGSAENTTFSAKVKEYNEMLFGNKTKGIPGIMDGLRRFYKGGPSFNII